MKKNNNMQSVNSTNPQFNKAKVDDRTKVSKPTIEDVIDSKEFVQDNEK